MNRDRRVGDHIALAPLIFGAASAVRSDLLFLWLCLFLWRTTEPTLFFESELLLEPFSLHLFVGRSSAIGFARLNWPTSLTYIGPPLRSRMQCAAGPDQGKGQKRIVRAAARGNAGSGCCQRKYRHDPAKIAPSFGLKQTPVE